jgi:hemolysin III
VTKTETRGDDDMRRHHMTAGSGQQAAACYHGLMDDVDGLRRLPTLGEEIANGVSHGVAALAGLIAAPFLIVRAAHRGGALAATGTAVFLATLVLLYLASTIYHALPRNRAKRVFRVLDHSAIYLLIAGTYTPFTLGILRGAWGWTLFGLVWTLAVCGTVMKAVAGVRYPRTSTALYIVMGWLALVAIRPLWLRIPLDGWLWLIAGGVAYTAGVAFYATDHRVRYGHFVWHLFVIAGTACHAVAVLWYAT